MVELVDTYALGAYALSVQVQILSRAPDYDNFDYFRPQGDFLLPSEARNISESGLAVRGSRAHFRLPLA